MNQLAGKSLGSNLRLTWGINKQTFVMFPGEEDSGFFCFFCFRISSTSLCVPGPSKALHI